MPSDLAEKPSSLDKAMGLIPPGIVILIAFLLVDLGLTIFARVRGKTLSDNASMALFCFILGWAYLSMWQVLRGCAALGLDRSSYAQFIWRPRSTDPEEAFLWRWTFHELCAFAALGAFLLILTYLA
jgi:hypothetical protein